MKSKLLKFAFICLISSVLIILNQSTLSQTNQTTNPCDNAKTTLEMRQCADKQYKKGNGELNQLYQKIMIKLDEKIKVSKNTLILKSKIIEAQRSWIVFRDKSCEVDRFMYQGGSFEPVALLNCLSGTTWLRVTDLKGLLEEISR